MTKITWPKYDPTIDRGPSCYRDCPRCGEDALLLCRLGVPPRESWMRCEDCGWESAAGPAAELRETWARESTP